MYQVFHDAETSNRSVNRLFTVIGGGGYEWHGSRSGAPVGRRRRGPQCYARANHGRKRIRHVSKFNYPNKSLETRLTVTSCDLTMINNWCY